MKRSRTIQRELSYLDVIFNKLYHVKAIRFDQATEAEGDFVTVWVGVADVEDMIVCLVSNHYIISTLGHILCATLLFQLAAIQFAVFLLCVIEYLCEVGNCYWMIKSAMWITVKLLFVLEMLVNQRL